MVGEEFFEVGFVKIAVGGKGGGGLEEFGELGDGELGLEFGEAAEMDGWVEGEGAEDERDELGVIGAFEVLEDVAGFLGGEVFGVVEFAEEAERGEEGVGGGLVFGLGLFEEGVGGDERGVEGGGEVFGGGGGVGFGVIEGESEAAGEFGEGCFVVGFVVEEELAVFEGFQALVGDGDFRAGGGGFPFG